MTMPDDHELEHRIERLRPVPRAAFRGELRRRLLDRSADAPPARLRTLVTAYVGSGALLLAVVALGLVGAGPLAA
jgi:hypothetical protein